MPAFTSTLSLNGLRCLVRLGCSAEEQAVPQAVHFDISLRFERLPEGCQTDRLADTICYSEISQALTALCQQGPYQLIEKLGYQAYTEIKNRLPGNILLQVRVTKEKPPIPELMGGASFCIDEGVWK